jgi:hypothetical protein
VPPHGVLIIPEQIRTHRRLRQPLAIHTEAEEPAQRLEHLGLRARAERARRVVDVDAGAGELVEADEAARRGERRKLLGERAVLAEGRRDDRRTLLSGTLGGRFRRRCTEQATWAAALGHAAILETAGTWDGAAPQPSTLAPPLPALVCMANRRATTSLPDIARRQREISVSC